MSEMRTLLIRKADIIDELDVGGEIGEVALGVSDAALPNTLAMRRLPRPACLRCDSECFQA